MKELITSRQNPQVRAVCALAEKKKRRECGLFRFDGVKLFVEAIAAQIEIESVFVRDPIADGVAEALHRAVESGCLREESIVAVSESVFEKISEERAPEGIVTVAHCPTALHARADRELSIRADERILIAESLRDPGNLGTVMRSCAALGIDRLILSDDCAELYNPKTVRSAMGALFRLPTLTVAEGELSTLIETLRKQGRRVYATALREDARKIGELTLRSGDCFVIGNEGHGLSEETIAACDATAIIPMREGNESLNAAAAAAICIWETVRH